MRSWMLVGALVPACLSRPDGTGSSDAVPSGPLAHVGVFVQQHATSTIMFSQQALHAGDAVTIQVSCGSASATMPAIDLIAPFAWQFTRLAAAGQAGFWAATFGGIAPDVHPATFITAVPADCGADGASLMGDEFTNNDPAGGTTTFDSRKGMAGYGFCETEVSPSTANEAVWAACVYGDTLGGPGPGYTASANDTNGNLSEYKLTTDPANTTETVSFAGPAQRLFVVTATSIKGL